MIALVWAIVGIGMVAALLYGGVSYFQGTAPVRAQVKDTATSAFQGMAAAYHAYINANNLAPTSGSWQTQMIPGYITELKYPVTGMTWSFATNATFGNYFCLSGSVSQMAYNGFNDASGNFPSSSYILDTTACGARSNASAPGSWPANLYITYWLRGA